MKIRTSSIVSSAISAHMFSKLEAFTEASGLSRSAVIRNALLHHAHKASSITVPAICIPRHSDYPNMVVINVSTNIKPDSLRREYETRAASCRIPMSTLVLRCLSAYVEP